jgi:hypothetical protein
METDLFGTFYLRASGGGRFAGYYSCLDAIPPLVRSQEWTENVTGFYINLVGTNYDAVRLSYWTTSREQTRRTVDRFVAEHSLEYIREPGTPSSTRAAS